MIPRACRLVASAAVALGTLAAGGCTDDAAPGPGDLSGGPEVGATVSVHGQGFHPGRVTVPVGRTVRWTNESDVAHTVTAADLRFDSGTVAPGESFEFLFEAPGETAYRCALHPEMTGTVVASAPSP